jgi:hypothetical protein
MIKNLSLLLLVTLSFISCSKQDDGLIETNNVQKSLNSRLSQNENVKLVSAWTSYSEKYSLASYTRKFKAEVKNLAFSKKVVVSHEMQDGSWKDFPLSYVSSTVDNTEIWGGNFTINTYDQVDPLLLFADEFVIRYEVNGQKYWDNNNKSNYKMGVLEGTFLRSDLNVFVDTDYNKIYNSYYTSGNNAFTVDADVRNLNPTKDVNLVYTSDNWVTTNTVPLRFNRTITVGAQQFLYSPNRFGIERWSANIQLPSTINKIEYAISYKANGKTYWDNNFGKNYIAVKVN